MFGLIKVIMCYRFGFSFLGLTVYLLLAVPRNQKDLPIDDDNFLVQATELFDKSKNLLLASVSAIGTGTVCKPFSFFFNNH